MQIRKALHSADNRIAQISEIFGVVAVGVLVCMMMLTVTDVCLRYFFLRPIMASKEITEYMMIVVGFLGLAWCAFKGMHIKVNLVVDRFSERTQAIIDIINHIIVIGLCVVFASQAFTESLIIKELGRGSDITGIPNYPFYLVVFFGFFLLLIVMVPILIKSIKKVLKK